VPELANGRIRHTVVFTPTHASGSEAEADFLAAAARLEEIPGVEAFEILRETSPKNAYRFGISMEFADGAAYASYNEHPDHVRFVQERWLPEVADFLEIDYEPRAC
jgi:heme-degrading monooxygenase HmoA